MPYITRNGITKFVPDDQYVDFINQEKLKSISMRQCRLILLQYNYLSTVNTAIQSLPEASQIEWEYAATVDRNNPLVSSIAQLLNLTEQQMDDMFTEASLL